jgi:hypothetical protein
MTPHTLAELLRRHLASGAALDPLAQATWLDPATLTTVAALGGKLPFPYDAEETAVVAQVHSVPRCAAYLRISGRVALDALRAGTAPGARLLGFALVDDDGRIVERAP